MVACGRAGSALFLPVLALHAQPCTRWHGWRGTLAGGCFQRGNQDSLPEQPPAPAERKCHLLSLQRFNLLFQTFLISVKSLVEDLWFEGWVYLKMKCFASLLLGFRHCFPQ